jgi:phosphopentomutase
MRALIIVLDSAGCGGAPDAAAYQDEGANTLGHLLRAQPELALPALDSLGLWKIVTGDVFSGRSQLTRCRWGRMRPLSRGKDSITGHWEMAGIIVETPFAVFAEPPEALRLALARQCRTQFLMAAATEEERIPEALGPEHVQTGRPILFTTADSALHVAAHEKVAPLGRLYDLCRQARKQADAARIAQVVARPFSGEPGGFRWTSGRHEFGITPPRTILNAIAETGLPVHGIGKIRRLFAGSGVTRSTPTQTNAEGLAAIAGAWKEGRDGLIFANLGDFDPVQGVRRGANGWVDGLREFDAWLMDFLPQVETDDLVIITADHGGDHPTRGPGFTREEVPLMVLHQGYVGPLGTRKSFADMAATLGEYFKLSERWPAGESFAFSPRLWMGTAGKKPK